MILTEGLGLEVINIKVFIIIIIIITYFLYFPFWYLLGSGIYESFQLPEVSSENLLSLPLYMAY